MSEENVEIVKEFSQLFEKGDRDKWREYFDPDVVWDTSARQLALGRRSSRPRGGGAVLPRLAWNLEGLRS